MEKITFVNNSEPYLSAENLNQMQSNIENAVNGITLYSDTTGTNGNIILSETSANFDYLEITDTTGNIYKVKVQSNFSLSNMTFNNTYKISHNFATNYSLNGTALNVVSYVGFERNYNTGTISGELSTNFITITKVVGYKL